MNVASKLKELGLTLPEPPRPVATYLPAVRSGNLLFVSGQLPFVDGKLQKVGKLGGNFTLEEGQAAAQRAALNALAIINQAAGLENVAQVVRLTVYIASATGFTDHPRVANGASELLIHVFGEPGRHARSAIGAAELPLGAPVEVELVVELKA
ncbi:MAG: RidA family protein [Dehalococcoidia bacterium]|nr:RidA family protein [Dehalococcoidia bacterium]